MTATVITQDQADELNAIFMLNKPGKKKKRILLWESALDACELGEYQVVPLTNSWVLRLEGRAMRNCVGSYDEICARGQFRVFSIRDGIGNRLATMSLEFRDEDWYLDQILGARNSELCLHEETDYDGEQTITRIEMTDFYYIAHEMVRCYRKAWEKRGAELILKPIRITDNNNSLTEKE